LNDLAIVIPARYSSLRFPGKLLQNLKGKPVIQWVHERAASTGIDQIFIATDSDEIEACAKKFKANVVRTQSTHINGTERIAEVAHHLQWPDDMQIINLQGDEPLINPAIIIQLAEMISNKSPDMATIVSNFSDINDYRNLSTAKVILDHHGFAVNFTRAFLPNVKLADIQSIVYRHHGIYGYKVSTLKKIIATKPSKLENFERLEQLRALWLGIKILTLPTTIESPRGIDTAQDLEYLETYLASE
jgi:3-deoxy-manno-octulosonate cytidylyltransferase (CMP-KDO synthetase)